MPNLGSELRKARVAAGLSQEDLSSRARVDRSYISQLERDLKSPTVDMLDRLCAHLGVKASAVLAVVEGSVATPAPAPEPIDDAPPTPRASNRPRRGA